MARGGTPEGSGLPSSTSARIRREYAAIRAGLARVSPTSLAFEPSAHDPAVVARLRTRWMKQLGDEHRSTFVFSALATQLAEAGASIETVAVMLRMAQDELRHTETCAVTLRSLGGASPAPTVDAAPRLAGHAGASPKQRALRNVLLTTCISEMHAVASFVAALDVVEEPFLRAKTREILADEVLHGEFGFAYLEELRGWLEDSPTERTDLARYLRYAFAWAEQALVPAANVRPPTPGEVAVGVLPLDVARDLYPRTMAEGIVPVLESFGIAAEDAWNRRSLV